MALRFRIAGTVFGCMTVAIATALPAVAQQAPASHPTTPENPIEVISKGLKLRADPVEPADFVRQSRPAEDQLNYLSTGGHRPEPDNKILTPDQVKAKQAEMEALLARHDRIAGRKPAAKTAANPPAVSPRKADAASAGR